MPTLHTAERFISRLDKPMKLLFEFCYDFDVTQSN